MSDPKKTIEQARKDGSGFKEEVARFPFAESFRIGKLSNFLKVDEKLEFVKAEIEGIEKLQCPECKELMVLAPSVLGLLAFCISCKQFYIESHENGDYGIERKMR